MKPRHLIPALLCALLIVYPLSTGPMGKIYYMHHPRTSIPSWAGIYKPLEWACDHFQKFDDAYMWYERLWLPTDD